MSMRPFWTRGKPLPRWSKFGGGVNAGSPASMAGLPVRRAWVWVRPPVFASGPSFGSMGVVAVPTWLPVVVSVMLVLVPSPVRLLAGEGSGVLDGVDRSVLHL